MPEELHNKIAKSVRKAHPGYSPARVEKETNRVLSNINVYGRGRMKGRKKTSSAKGKRGKGRKK